jgi:hypothetical protein
MFEDKFPKFTPGRVLKNDMLGALRDYPRDYVEILYSHYSDGILAGCLPVVSSEFISISPGLIRYQGKLFTLREAVSLPYFATGRDTIIKVSFGKAKESGDYILTSGDITLVPGVKLAENEIELGRFKLKLGARLRDEYQDFADYATDYDTVNIINVPFAAPYESTLSPVLTRRFAMEAFEGRPVHPFDYTFISLCAQGEPVAKSLITAYSSARLGIAANDSTNQDMHRHLAKILDDIRAGKDMAKRNGRSGGWKVLVE